MHVTHNAAPDDPVHIEPAIESLEGVSNEGALAALEASLSGAPAPLPAPVDPKPGDTKPAPDSAPRVPEGDGETDPDDNAPPGDVPKPDDKKTVVPTDPKVDDPAVQPKPDGGMEKRPSDVFGELPKDAKAETAQRFEAMKTSYDKLSKDHDTAVAERDNYRSQADKWVETVSSTGANPEQFGMALEYLRLVNAGTPEALNQAFDLMLSEVQVVAEHLGRDIPGLVDPLKGFDDLKRRVEDEDLNREDAIQIAQARRTAKMRAEVNDQTQKAGTHQALVTQSLDQVKAFGAQMRATDPHYEAKTAAIKPMVERVVAHLPPDQWLGAVKELYAGVPNPAAAPPPAATRTDDPALVSPLRPTSSPSAGGGVNKAPGNALEALDMALKSL